MSDFLLFFKDIFLQSASIAMMMIFVENAVFSRALDTSSILYNLRKRHSIGIFSVILTAIVTASCCIIYVFRQQIEHLSYSYYMKPLIYVAIIGAVYILTLLFCSLFLKKHEQKIRPMIHLAAFNGAVFGGLLLSHVAKYNIWGQISFGLGVGIGYALAAYLISIGYERLNSDRIPQSFRGFPITLIYVGILSLAFYGLIGHELTV